MIAMNHRFQPTKKYVSERISPPAGLAGRLKAGPQLSQDPQQGGFANATWASGWDLTI